MGYRSDVEIVLRTCSKFFDDFGEEFLIRVVDDYFVLNNFSPPDEDSLLKNLFIIVHDRPLISQ